MIIFCKGITIFLTFSVSAVRISSSIPTQSQYLPPIILYFMLSQLFTLCAFIWFTIDSVLRAEAYIPGFMTSFGRMLRFVASFLLKTLHDVKQKILCCKCFKKKEENDFSDIKSNTENNAAVAVEVWQFIFDLHTVTKSILFISTSRFPQPLFL
jgi:hypothetical protein